MAIHQAVVQTFTTDNYLGEGLTNKGQPQVYIKVGEEALVLGMSKKFFEKEDHDKRSLSLVDTMFFIPIGEFETRSVTRNNECKY